MNLLLRAGAMALAFLPSMASAQTGTSVQFPAGWAPSTSICVKQGDGTCAPVSTTNPMPVSGGTGGGIDTVVKGAAVDRGAAVGMAAVTLLAANPARRGFALQVQSTSASCYINGATAATADFHSLLVAPGAYYETPSTHVGTGAISIICTAAATPVYAREW